MATNRAYPFIGKNQPCDERTKSSQSESTKFNIKGIYKVGSSFEQISRALSYGPIAAQIDGNSWMLKNYKKGIINKFSSCGQNIDHAVLIVGHGYDRATKQNYLIIKNSWGTEWGEKGYARLSADVTPKYPKGMCGIYSRPIMAMIDV